MTATAFNRDQKGREHAGDLKGQRRIDDNKWWQLLTSKQGFDLKYCWTSSLGKSSAFSGKSTFFGLFGLLLVIKRAQGLELEKAVSRTWYGRILGPNCELRKEWIDTSLMAKVGRAYQDFSVKRTIKMVGLLGLIFHSRFVDLRCWTLHLPK